LKSRVHHDPKFRVAQVASRAIWRIVTWVISVGTCAAGRGGEVQVDEATPDESALRFAEEPFIKAELVEVVAMALAKMRLSLKARGGRQG
jgi:hypothetical protein